MCGILGYIGKENCKDFLLSSLKKLEYRGYDSCGIGLVTSNNFLSIYKTKGKVENLKQLIPNNINSTIGIGHTRWATHGKVNTLNAHPHMSASNNFMLVHNGVVTNYKKLKIEYLNDYIFKSETDTEVIVNLIDYWYIKFKDIKIALIKTLSLLEGSYAFILATNLNKNLYFAKKDMPLILGYDNDHNGYFSSDISSISKQILNYSNIEESGFGMIDFDTTQCFYFDTIGNPLDLKFEEVSFEILPSDKGIYSSYMLKEIHDEPFIIQNLISNYYNEDAININTNLLNQIKTADKINIIGCGSSMNAGLFLKYYFEKLCEIHSEVFCASELIYSKPLLTENPFFIYLSQSGETADIIKVIKKFKAYPSLSITNNPLSIITSLTTYNLNLYAGHEISVAATKSYISEIIIGALLAKAVSGQRTNLKTNLNHIIYNLQEVLNNKKIYKFVSETIIDSNLDVYYIGRGLDYWSAKEAALKLKEVSYIHTEAYPSGELKHGPIALIEEGSPVIGIITQEGVNSIVRTNLKELKSRGAKTLIISSKALAEDDDIIIPDCAHYLTPILVATVCQLIAYYCAELKNLEIDTPRNLAKSVTVE